MQHMDVPLGGNPLQFSVDITYSHSNWKPNLSTFSDDMQLGSHYRNSNCSFGDTDISYNIGREDIWDAKVSYLDDGFPHEREDDISWKYWPHKIDGNSGEFLDYENGHMPDNAFEGHHMLRKMGNLQILGMIVGLSYLQEGAVKCESVTQPGWPFFETEDPKDSLSLASSSHCTSQANFPSVGSQLWAEHPIGAFPIPELNLDYSRSIKRVLSPGSGKQGVPLDLFDAGQHREIGFPNLSLIQGAHSNGSNDKDDEFKEAKDGILETKGSHGVETSSSVKIHEKGESKGAQYRIRNERAKVEEGKAINREDNLNRSSPNISLNEGDCCWGCGVCDDDLDAKLEGNNHPCPSYLALSLAKAYGWTDRVVANLDRIKSSQTDLGCRKGVTRASPDTAMSAAATAASLWSAVVGLRWLISGRVTLLLGLY
ncbi:hypothetical protein PVK06_004640 [Gossypium arboreum]|uniref:Uncharacterized protein n=1 Tax=Gossypium arboreum TaxID=29729 RepID=A0ABR0QTV8_GOSAR|nr:hypothetical protein PVK06_004640 [Gossypium arboreum]